MKKLIVILGLLFCASGICSAQEKGFTYGLWTTIGTDIGREEPGFQTMELTIAPGYAFNPSLYLRLPLEFAVGMWDGGGIAKTYHQNGTIGLSLGWNIVKNNSGWGVVDLAASVGNSLYNKEWSYLYYDLGASWAVGGKRKMLFGLGVKYYDSHKTTFKNYCNFYGKVGFRFN